MMDQTHIGYTYWNQPVLNAMPGVQEVQPNGGSGDGSRGRRLPREAGRAAGAESPVLPTLDVYSQGAPIPRGLQSRPAAVRVQHRGERSLASGGAGVRLGGARPARVGERRLEHGPQGTASGSLVISGPKGAKVTVKVQVRNPESPTGRTSMQGFVESDGYVSIEAEHYTRAVAPGRAELAPHSRPRPHALGDGGTLPVTAPSIAPGPQGQWLEYAVHFFSKGTFSVEAHLAPTQKIQPGAGFRYAVSFDDETPQVVNVHADGSLAALGEDGGRRRRRPSLEARDRRAGPPRAEVLGPGPGPRAAEAGRGHGRAAPELPRAAGERSPPGRGASRGSAHPEMSPETLARRQDRTVLGTMRPTVVAAGKEGTMRRLLGLLLFVPATGLAQPSGGPYGPIHQSYKVPEKAAHVYYVAPDGKADAPGTTLAEPTTIESAISRVVTGDAIVLRGGVYRTGGLRLNQGITLQPYADERPVLKGTQVAEKWENLRNNVWRTSWKTLFPAKPLGWWQRNREGMRTPLHRFNNDMVFVDGAMLKSAGWEGELDPHSYYIDYEAGHVYIGADPTSRLVEITAFDNALIRTSGPAHGKTSDKKGPVIRGITFTQYAYRAIDIEGKKPAPP